MGCVSSREAKLDRRRNMLPSDRSHSMPVIHGPSRRGDSLHVVSLTFSTLGSLRLEASREVLSDEEMKKVANDRRTVVASAGHVEQQEPETETINAWELMEGLEEGGAPPLRPSLAASAAAIDRSFSFDAIRNPPKAPLALSKSSVTSAEGSPKPFWMQTAARESAQLDPEVISNFRKAMTELSPQHPTLRRRLSPVRYRPEEIPKFPGIVKARVAAFQEKIDARRASFRSASNLKISHLEKPPPGGKGKVVLYTTSLRGVRKTYEDCCNARAILRSYGARIDERDVSMHGGFRDELSDILGIGAGLPRVFANGRCLGGAEEVAQMHENGELREALKECETVEGNSGRGCEGCGDFRFVPCEVCSGSCKVFVEEEEDEMGGFMRCASCNENGLVRCPLCC